MAVGDDEPIAQSGSEILHPKRTPILHVQVRLRQAGGGNRVRFSSFIEPGQGPSTGTDIEDFVKDLSNKAGIGPSLVQGAFVEVFLKLENVFRALASLFEPNTPLDVNPTQKCHIVFELDPTVNWRFTPGSKGITCKNKNYQHEDYGLTFAADGKTYKARPNPANPKEFQGVPENCRVLYWGILARKKGEARGFNFYVDFQQTKDSEAHVMPLVVDPNIPNTGGSTIP